MVWLRGLTGANVIPFKKASGALYDVILKALSPRRESAKKFSIVVIFIQ